jgi:hypothetical protein
MRLADDGEIEFASPQEVALLLSDLAAAEAAWKAVSALAASLTRDLEAASQTCATLERMLTEHSAGVTHGHLLPMSHPIAQQRAALAHALTVIANGRAHLERDTGNLSRAREGLDALRFVIDRLFVSQGHAPPSGIHRCEGCGAPLPPRRKRFCTRRCRYTKSRTSSRRLQ